MTRICPVANLQPERGAAALVGGEAVALFLVDGEVLAIGNVDPFSGASVLSRGIVGSQGDVLTVASPVYKQRFDLRTGRSLDDDRVSVPTYPVQVVDGWVELVA
jgi:nitrite reductase (NADH) small subunit